MIKTMGHKIFADYAAKRRFVDLYEMMSAPDQAELGERVRKLFDEKITSLNSIENFYLTDKDVERCFHEMKAAHAV